MRQFHYLEAAGALTATDLELDFWGVVPDMTGEPLPVGVTDSLPDDISNSI